MKKLLVMLQIICLLLVSQAATATTLMPPAKSQMTADWQRAKAYTQEYLAAMPAAGTGFKPTPEMRSFAQQMLHLAQANFMIAATISGKANPYQGQSLENLPDYQTEEALAKVVLESYDFIMSALNNATEAQLSQHIKLFNQELTRELAFQKAFEHQTHHRGQTTVYLRLKGIKPPNEKLF